MKKTFLLLSLSIGLNLFSQTGVVDYGYIESLTIGNAQGDDYNAVLKFNDNQAYYVTGKESLETPERINKTSVYKDADGNGGYISEGLVVTNNGNQVVTNLADNAMCSNIKYGKQYFLKESIPAMKWRIDKTQTKKIGTFNCLKATTTFRGRNYTAWFTTEVPVLFGPWKFNGLPGLILEVYDTHKNVYWYFKSIQYPAKDTVVPDHLLNEDLKPQKDFLDVNHYAQKLKDLIQGTNDSGLIMAKQSDATPVPTKYDDVFIEKF